MCQRHTFGGICDQITGNQGIFHADMTHSDTITDCDRRKYNRCSASHRYTQLHGIYNLVQVHVSRNNLIIRTYDTDERFVHLLFRHTECIKQRTVRCLLHPFSYCITFHLFVSFYLFRRPPPLVTGAVFTFIFDFIAFMKFLQSFYLILSQISLPISTVPTCLQPSAMISTVR